LYKVTLSRTPPGEEALLSQHSETQTYIAGEDCMQRLILYHGLYHFRSRLQACLLLKLKQQERYNRTHGLKHLIRGILKREQYMRFLIWVYRQIKRWGVLLVPGLPASVIVPSLC
jgi:hypothetical protein